MGYSHDDPSLRTGDGGLTVWTLQEMAQGKRFNELDSLFNNGLTMDASPVGYAAGTAVPVLDLGSKLVAEALNYLKVDSRYLKLDVKQLIGDTLDSLVGRGWRGKVYFQSNNERISKGRNRMREFLVLPNSPIVPMNKFDTMLLDSHPLASGATSNVVVLNYADPLTRPYWQELVIAKVPVYDVMVAVKGKYGPIFVGKTWLGRYDKKREFTALDPDKLIARYFLDFNDGALKEQREQHWDGSEEEFLDPIPQVDD